MDTAPQITFRHIEPDEALRAAIDELIDKLTRQVPRLHALNLTLEGPSQAHRSGAAHDVRLELHLPRNEIVIQTASALEPLDALHEAFRIARRRAHEVIDKIAGA